MWFEDDTGWNYWYGLIRGNEGGKWVNERINLHVHLSYMRKKSLTLSNKEENCFLPLLSALYYIDVLWALRDFSFIDSYIDVSC
jgi:hypothetical protein